jgi:hypothetical protein
MENNDSTLSGPKLMDKENLKAFYKDRLPQLIKTVFVSPVRGTKQLFENTSAETYKNSLMLILSIMVLYLITPYLLAGSELRSMLTFSILIKSSFTSGLFMVLVSLLSFGIKMISGKPVFKNELLTGALCGIGLLLFLVVFVLAKIFIGELSMYDLMSPEGIIGKMQYLLLLILYVLLFLINVFQQSLRASGTNDAISWYLAPVSILLAFYLTFKIALVFF